MLSGQCQCLLYIISPWPASDYATSRCSVAPASSEQFSQHSCNFQYTSGPLKVNSRATSENRRQAEQQTNVETSHLHPNLPTFLLLLNTLSVSPEDASLRRPASSYGSYRCTWYSLAILRVFVAWERCGGS